MYVIAGKACEDCGGDMAIRVMSKEPTEEDKKDLRDELGGMWCIEVSVFSAELDGPIEINETD